MSEARAKNAARAGDPSPAAALGRAPLMLSSRFSRPHRRVGHGPRAASTPRVRRQGVLKSADMDLRPFHLLCCLSLGWAAACAGGAARTPHHAHPDGAQQAQRSHPGHPAHGAHPSPLVHRFENADQWTAEFDNPERDAWQQPSAVVAAMAIEPGMIVADIGAGTGYFEPYLSRAVGAAGQVLAMDVEQDMVRYLKERAGREKLSNVQATLVAGDDPRLAPGSVDRILIVDTWHHIPERTGYAQKLRTGLKAGGRIFVVDFTAEAQHGPPPRHRIPPEQVVEELQASGLAAEVLPESLPEQYIVVATQQELPSP